MVDKASDTEEQPLIETYFRIRRFEAEVWVMTYVRRRLDPCHVWHMTQPRYCGANGAFPS
jgi:hypothetical protein